MKTLIIGFGSIGKKHHFNLNLLGEDDIDIYDTQNIEDSDYETLTKKDLKHYDLVLICTPPDNHLDYLEMCQDVPYVFVEKPLSVAPFDFERMNKPKGQIFVGYAYRFERGINKLKELINEGVAGRIRHASLENSYSFIKMHPQYDHDKWEGIIYDDSHIGNYSRYLFGDPIEFKSKYISQDFAQWNWKTDQGILVSHMTDVLNERYKKRIEVRGEKGTLIWNYKAHEVFFAPADESERRALPYKHADHLLEEMRYVVDVVKNKGEFKENFIKDAIFDLRITEELLK